MKLGCYYFNWQEASKWRSIIDFKEVDLTPTLGLYDDKRPAVHDWHIRQAIRHGIGYWMFDWYFDVAKGREYAGNNTMLDQGFLQAERCLEMEFAVMWCNEERDFTTYSRRDFLALVEIWGREYFHRVNYLKAPDGRCVVSMTRPDRLIDTLGYEGTRLALETMREAARPWGGLYFTTIKYPTIHELTLLKEAGFDACTLYSYNQDGMAPGELCGPFETILDHVEPIWREGAESGIMPVVPLVCPNWDSRPWAGIDVRGTWRSDPTPEKFEHMCRTLKQYVDPWLQMAIIGTWNEFGEGSHIEPTVPLGCAYLDALQRGFFPENYQPHELLAPTEEEKKALVYDEIPPVWNR